MYCQSGQAKKVVKGLTYSMDRQTRSTSIIFVGKASVKIATWSWKDNIKTNLMEMEVN